MIKADAFGPYEISVYVAYYRFQQGDASDEGGFDIFKSPVDDSLRYADRKHGGAQYPQIFRRRKHAAVFKSDK